MCYIQLKRRAGFTLIELVLVMIIMAVLAAAALPTLGGFVTQGGQSVALAECQAAVRAAQAKTDNLALQGSIASLSSDATRKALQKEHGLPGSIDSITADLSQRLITYLLYTASNGLRVEYTRSLEGTVSPPTYTIVETPTGGLGGADINFGSLADLAQAAKEMANALAKATGNSSNPGRNAVISALENSKVPFPQVNEAELTAAGLTGTLYWKPYYLGRATSSNPYVFFFATTNLDGWGGWYTKLLWIDGILYCNSSGKTIADIHYAGRKDSSSSGAELTDHQVIQEQVIAWAKTNGFIEKGAA